ncbi:MAG: biotin--[acetyl-CoA-carboxylase] ligase [Anaerolineaceae bacterium]|nr:biotin--[acetyl-CoA-carboxylase] ligase [Anaerolineaceae bacterium]
MNVSLITSRLTGLPIPQIRYYDVIGSTNDEALRWAAAGAADGCLVVANQQTSGRGRLGRRWVTTPGAALAFSLIMLPYPAEQAQSSFFTALGALAVCQALETRLGLAVQIKWPNDILLEGKKTAGILVEANWMGQEMQSVVIGIGVNIAAESVPPASELLFPATSVEQNTRKKVDRIDLLRAILQGFVDWRVQLQKGGIRSAWEDRLAFKGDWVNIEETASPAGSTPLTGQVMGLDDSGSLLLRSAAGAIVRVAVGDLHLRLIE